MLYNEEYDVFYLKLAKISILATDSNSFELSVTLDI